VTPTSTGTALDTVGIEPHRGKPSTNRLEACRVCNLVVDYHVVDSAYRAGSADRRASRVEAQKQQLVLGLLPEGKGKPLDRMKWVAQFDHY
jgi:hypothetical protein